MDTMKDTKMQPATDAVIEELRKVIADCYWPTSPVTINEILDRLEAAEKDIARKEKVIDALGSGLNAAAKERDKLKELNSALCTKSNSQVIHNARLAEENDALRAKVEQMERQELGYRERCTPSSPAGGSNRFPLYALPGAQPAPSVQDASVRKAWARFSHELHRSPDAPYPGMADAFEQHFSQSFIDREWRAEAATWAAAWKAAKRHCAQPAPSVPEGWKLVPIVSTDEMDNAGSEHCDGYLSTAQVVWDAMLAAAPEFKP